MTRTYLTGGVYQSRLSLNILLECLSKKTSTSSIFHRDAPPIFSGLGSIPWEAQRQIVERETLSIDPSSQSVRNWYFIFNPFAYIAIILMVNWATYTVRTSGSF